MAKIYPFPSRMSSHVLRSVSHTSREIAYELLQQEPFVEKIKGGLDQMSNTMRHIGEMVEDQGKSLEQIRELNQMCEAAIASGSVDEMVAARDRLWAIIHNQAAD